MYEVRIADAETPADWLCELPALPADDLDREIAELAETEDRLQDPARYPATPARLRASLALDPEFARVVARSWGHSIAFLRSGYRVRSVEAERRVLLNALSYSEFRRLAGLAPWLEQDAVSLAGGAR